MNGLRYAPTLLFLLVCLPLAGHPAVPRSIEPDAELSGFLEDREVVFLARDLRGPGVFALAAERIDERHPPFSTFKVPNFLIALETSVINDAHALRAWEARRRPAESFWPESWKQPQSLVTAFRRSALWFFRDVALEVGGADYRKILTHFGYGNGVAADGNDAFWLDGTLQISPREQVDFLSRLLRGELEVTPASIEALQGASALSEAGDCRLHGKTGAGPVGDGFDGPFEGWLVGWSQCSERPPTVFALWTRAQSFAAIRSFRQDAVTRLLAHLGRFPNPEETP